MRWPCRVLVLMITGPLALPVAAQTPPSKPPADARKPAAKLPEEKAYKPIAVKISPAPDDPAFAAFRQAFSAAAKSRVYAELARLVVARGFFWEGNVGGVDPARSSMENFSAAVRLEHEGGSGWKALAAFASASSAEPLPSRPGVICAPAAPQYDLVDFDRAMSATGTTAAAWKYLSEPDTPLRGAPRPNARAVEVLGPQMVRPLHGEGIDNSEAARAGWALVAAPSGKTGYIAAAMLMPLRSDKLCYHKDVTGRWRIVGFIAAGG